MAAETRNRRENSHFSAGRITFRVVSINAAGKTTVLEVVHTSSALKFLADARTLPGFLSYNEGEVERHNGCLRLVTKPSMKQAFLVQGVTYIGYGSHFERTQTSSGRQIRLSCIMEQGEFKIAEEKMKQQSGNLLGNAFDQVGLTQSPEPPPSTQVAVAGQMAMGPSKPIGMVLPVKAVSDSDVATANAARLKKLEDKWKKGPSIRKQPKATLPLVTARQPATAQH